MLIKGNLNDSSKIVMPVVTFDPYKYQNLASTFWCQIDGLKKTGFRFL